MRRPTTGDDTPLGAAGLLAQVDREKAVQRTRDVLLDPLSRYDARNACAAVAMESDLVADLGRLDEFDLFGVATIGEPDGVTKAAHERGRYRREPTISVCLPVRNAAGTLERFLASFRPHVDELCFLDTGSTDETLAILADHAGRPGAPIIVERAEWTDDYAAARNAADGLASCDYIAWAEDDEVLLGGEALRAAVRSRPDLVIARRLQVESRDLVGAYFGARIYPRHLSGRWVGPVHEGLAIEDELEASRIAVLSPGDVEIAHLPQPAPLRHDHRQLVEAALATEPSRALWFYLGRHLLEENGDLPGAEDAFRRAATWSESCTRGELPIVERSWHLIAYVRNEQGDRWGAREALRAMQQARAERLVDPVWRRCEELGVRYPIRDDHAVWALADRAHVALAGEAA